MQLANERRFPAAQDVLTTSLDIATDVDLRARVSGTLAYVTAQLGDAAAGEQLCRAALALTGLSSHTAGVVAGQLGSLLASQGRLGEALEWLGRAIETIEDDPIAVANLRMNRSVLNMQRADLDESAADLQVAAEIYAEHGSKVEVAEAQHNLGYVALLRGDLVEALQQMSAARPVIADVSAVNAAIGDVDRAEVLREAGQVRDAERLLIQAATALSRNRMPQAAAEARFHLARSLLRHDAQAAAKAARAAARQFAALDSALWRARAEAVALRAVLASGGTDVEGRPVPTIRGRWSPADVERVADELSKQRLRNEALALRLSYELWRARRGPSSGRLPRVHQTASFEVRLLAHEVRTARSARAGRDADALRHAAAGLDEIERWRTSFANLDLQSSLRMHGNTLAMAGLSAAVKSRSPEVVFEWSERARYLTQQVAPLRPSPDPGLAARLAELRMLRADLASSDWLANPRVVELTAEIRSQQWAAGVESVQVDRFDLDGVRRSLGPDTALLSYVFSPVGVVCLISTQAGDDVVEVRDFDALRASLPALRADLDLRATVRSGRMSGVIGASLSRQLDELSRALLAEPLEKTAASRLVLTVPGVLSGLPWSMLPHMTGRTFTLAGSATQWAHGRARPSEPSRSAGFAVGPRVPRGRSEAEAGCREWEGARLLADEAAGVDAVAELANGVDVLHVAAHGRHAVDNALFSGLELNDGVLFGYDIDRISQIPKTVVLSACELGRSTVRWGTEAIGMTQAWLHAGTRCVIAAPVLVADDDACEVLGAVHSGLAAGESPASALRSATEQTGIAVPFQCHGDGL